MPGPGGKRTFASRDDVFLATFRLVACGYRFNSKETGGIEHLRTSFYCNELPMSLVPCDRKSHGQQLAEAKLLQAQSNPVTDRPLYNIY